MDEGGPFCAKGTAKVHLYGTSEELPDEPMTFLGTVHLPSGSLVFHVFERQRPLSIIKPGDRRVCGGPGGAYRVHEGAEGVRAVGE